MTLLFYLCRVFPIKNNKIVFSNFSGKGYGDNAKYIAEELMLENPSNYDLVWLCDKENELFPDGIRIVKRLSIRSIYEQCTSKIWIDNRRKPIYVRKRRDQFYIQTWHGMTALKRVEKDAEGSLPKLYIKAAKNDSKMANLFLAASQFDLSLFRNSFWYSGEILKCGYPRHDILFENSALKKKQIKQSLGINPEYKIVLYAPTFRRMEDGSELELYDIGWNDLLKAFNDRFEDVWIGAMRLHPNISQFASKLDIPNTVINVTDYPDMQELLLISDCVISDYSSALIEHAMTGKMCYIFAVDITKYSEDRGFYFDFNELPFSVAKTKEELIENIWAFDEKDYEKKIYGFYHNRYGLFEGGSAAKQVVERLNIEMLQ